MPFFTLSNADIEFGEKKLIWRSYNIAEALPITKWVELIDKKEFTKTALDEKSETFVVHIAALKVSQGSAEITMHHSQTTQIAAWKQDEAPIKVIPKYVDYADVFSFDLAMKLFKNTGINEHTIKLQDSKQPPYGPIYSLELVKLETLKTYIKTHFKTEFNQSSKSSAGAPILFNKKPDSSLWLCVNYQDLNNLTVKNQYPLPLIDEALD